MGVVVVVDDDDDHDDDDHDNDDDDADDGDVVVDVEQREMEESCKKVLSRVCTSNIRTNFFAPFWLAPALRKRCAGHAPKRLLGLRADEDPQCRLDGL